MNARPPSERVREVVAGFLEANDLLPMVDVGYERAADGNEAILLKPRADGAADVVVRTAGHADSYVVYVFVAGEARPIEIAGPINENTDPPFRSADEDLLEVLHLVARGEVFDEIDEAGHVTGTDVPDPRTATGSVEGPERRRWYEPWASTA
ncbi:hypothetical protein [Modestobacter sp. VKM Ac-2985]|uniref:hypothetical protein n=1 Tax=Modestobacter sp. VKM Ac-2985 TaxID=3004139 RepID=UPI0022ABB2CE|nr:hypothetical protein [Modestobacter sp. VKM Ac-2985]MCZ2838269.1 hypothetical protein [Modestobacter sp. VKM Ac-2985]